MLKKSAYILFAFSLLLAAGGCFAFAKAGSLISLLSSTGFALLFSLCALAMLKNRTAGATIAVIGLAQLALFSMMRLSQTRSFMPAGLLLILSTVIFCLIGYTLRKARA